MFSSNDSLCLLVNSAVKHQAPGPRWAPLHAPRIGSELPGEKRRDAQERVIRHPLGNKQKTMENHFFFFKCLIWVNQLEMAIDYNSIELFYYHWINLQ